MPYVNKHDVLRFDISVKNLIFVHEGNRIK
jgi:hypothetical protein